MGFANVLRKNFGLDYRSMAFYRFLMGIIVMGDVISRIPDITNFYTDIGLIPRSIFISEMGMPWSFSLHLASGSLFFQSLLFLVHFIFGMMLCLGYKTRWAAIGCYLMTLSLHNRNWTVNNGGDDILRAILFLSIFLPLNKFFSVDSALAPEDEKPKSQVYVSTWSWAFLFQIFAIYFVSYILKDHAIWRTDFTAMYFASRLDIFSTSLGIWVRDIPWLLKFITIYTIYVEWLAPIFLYIGFIFGKRWWIARFIVVILFWALHFGIILHMKIGLFPWLCIFMWCILIPSEIWDLLLGKLRQKFDTDFIIYYDGECLFCQKAVRLLKEFILFPETQIKRAQDYTEIYTSMRRENSWVVESHGKKFFRFEALIELFRHSPLKFWLVRPLSISWVSQIGNAIYLWISEHRPLIGQFTQYVELKSARKEVPFFRWISEILGAVILITIIMWNLTTVKKWGIRSPFFQTISRYLHIYQEWNMFAPFPKTDNVWVEIPATLSDGQEIELLTGDKDIYSIKDQAFLKTVPNEHWRKFYLNLSDKTEYARYYGGYLCRLWNERHIRKVPSTTLRKFEILVYSQINLLGNEKGPINRKLSWKHWCFDEDYKKESGIQKK